ncbi:MAG: hypothetical protein H7Y38_04545 [Armatimonadetes bacterium]|nr:hypothetical protein [Armatimonadota bacterium]
MNEPTQYQLFRYLHERSEMSWVERFEVSVGLMLSAARRSEYVHMARMHRDLTAHFAPVGSPAVPVTPTLFSPMVAFVAVALLLSGLAFSAYRMRSATTSNATASASRCEHCHRSTKQCPHCSLPPPVYVCP